MSIDKFGRHSSGRSRAAPYDLVRSKSGDYDVGGKRLSNVADPLENTDAVNQRFLTLSVPRRSDKDMSYSFHQYVLKGIARPKENGDAVNLAYIRNNCLLLGRPYIDARSKPVVNVFPPTNDNDAVTLKYMTDRVLCKSVTEPHLYDAKKCRIKNLSHPYAADDATTKGYVKEMIGDLAYTIYLQLANPIRSRSSTISREEWDSRVSHEEKWSDLFK